MVLHVLLLRPRPGLTDDEVRAFSAAVARARTEIPAIRRVRLGRRVLLGREYERAMTEDFEYSLVLEFDDRAALEAYLDHPAHAELGRLYGTALASALAYDYEMVEIVGGEDIEGWIRASAASPSKKNL